jgi:long-chain acyl-CoA synthetase
VPTLVSHFNQSINKYSDKTALIFGDTRISYERLGEAVKRLARALQNLGVEKGDCVAVMLPNLPHFPISYYAILEIGAVVVPLNFLSSTDLDYFLNDCNAKAIIAWSGFADVVLNAKERLNTPLDLIFLGSDVPQDTRSLTQLMQENEPIEYFEAAKENELAAILYTAGISGQPHGAEMEHIALVSNALLCKEMLNITNRDISLGILPLFHPVAQTFSMNATFFSGGTLVLLSRYTIAALSQTLQTHSPTVMVAVPLIFQELLKETVAKTDSFKFSLCYGATLAEEETQRLEQKFNTRVLPAYGFTEAGPFVSLQRYGDEPKPGSVGLPIIGIELQIRDEKGNQLPPNKIGEIWVKSPSTMRGYHNRPKENGLYLKDGWVFSGDIGFLDMEYNLYIKERQEEIISRGGFSVYPSEVEACFYRHIGVRDVAVVGVINSTMGSELKAYVVLKPGQQVSKEELLNLCDALPAYMVPKHIEFVSSIPKTKTGRKLKRLLRSIAETAILQDRRNK